MQEWLKHKQCFLFDLDGTVFLGEEPIAGTIAFLQKVLPHKTIRFVTNNTSHSPRKYVQKLQSMGLEVSEEHILTPLLPLLEQVEQEGIKNLFSLFPPEVLAYLKEKAPQINWQSSVEEAQGLVVGFDTSLDYEKLSKAARILQKEGSFYWATHLDKVCPTPNGGIPDCGSMVALLNEVNHREPQLVFGKPDPRLLGSLGKEFALEEMVFSGDRLYTDQELAIRAKMDFVLVLSGESSREDIKENTPVPTHIVEDWGEFLK